MTFAVHTEARPTGNARIRFGAGLQSEVLVVVRHGSETSTYTTWRPYREDDQWLGRSS